MSEAGSGSEDVFDVDRIRRLVELMEQHDLREVDLRQAEHRIRLRRGSETVYTLPSGPAVPAGLPPAAVPSPLASSDAVVPAPRGEPLDSYIVVVKSPMVGTFYARANPNAEPYVKVGDVVAPETTVCVIEAMKVFNEIPAETAGKIVAVLVDEEEPVDHGRPLFKIDTRGS
jgi:acetyl-CoA carboxylase biotin carboxyl carrier protein